MTALGGLALLAAGLIGVIALELNNAPHIDGRRTPSHTTGATAPTPPAAADRTPEWVATALARPLFSPDRRPAAVAASAVGASLPGLPRLAGIVVGPFGRSAIFAVDGGKPIVVPEGGQIAAYTVTSIQAAEVRLVGPDGAQVVHPSFEPGAKQTAGSTTPPRRPGQPAPPR
jgi:hypothetical protein